MLRKDEAFVYKFNNNVCVNSSVGSTYFFCFDIFNVIVHILNLFYVNLTSICDIINILFYICARKGIKIVATQFLYR